MTAIVTVNVSQQTPPAPSTLQRTGAIISTGATNTSANTRTLLTQPSDLTPILNGALALTSLTQSGGLATATTTAPHGLVNGDVYVITIAGASPAAYNGTWECTITGASTFTYPAHGTGLLPSGTTSPATGTIVYTLEDVSELLAQVTTFFGQGTSASVYVLELGKLDVTDAVAALQAWITANPGFFYSYLLPRTWDANAAMLAMFASFENTTAKTYFFVTTTLQNYGLYTSLMKCVVAMIESPAIGTWATNTIAAATYSDLTVTFTTTTAHGVAVGQWYQITGMTPASYNGWYLAEQGTTGSTLISRVYAALASATVMGSLLPSYYSNAGIPSTEFSHAADFYVSLNYNPTSTNKVAPFNLSYLYGVTAFPTQGNSSLLSTLQAANINIVGTGAAGGISATLLQGGNTMDGNTFNYWYSVDWVQINVALNITNAVINGSNTPVNPLYLNQAGIDTLQGVGARTLGSAVSYGLALGSVVQTELTATALVDALAAGTYAGNVLINAVPFADYYHSSPNDYAIGKYGGFTCVYTPQRGFAQIIFDVIVTNFVAP